MRMHRFGGRIAESTETLLVLACAGRSLRVDKRARQFRETWRALWLVPRERVHGFDEIVGVTIAGQGALPEHPRYWTVELIRREASRWVVFTGDDMATVTRISEAIARLTGKPYIPLANAGT